VGQALIKRDLRPIAPGSVAQARGYLAGADIVFTNLEGTVAPADAAVTPRSPTAAYGRNVTPAGDPTRAMPDRGA
ncbi:MAG: hypothetical protein ACO3P8_11885, partial [Steroidobacteraceae bacterium]